MQGTSATDGSCSAALNDDDNNGSFVFEEVNLEVASPSQLRRSVEVEFEEEPQLRRK